MQLLHQVLLLLQVFQNICMFKSLLSRSVEIVTCWAINTKQPPVTCCFYSPWVKVLISCFQAFWRYSQKKKEFYFRSGFLLAGRWEEARSSPPAPLTTSWNSHHIKVFKTYQHGGGAAELISDREIAEHKINHNRPAYFFLADSLFDVSLHSW